MIRSLPYISLLLASVAVAADALAQSRNQPAVLAGEGRYVFGQVNEYNADQYMLDTQSGRLWRLVDTGDGGASVLEAVPYLLPAGGTQATPPEGLDLRQPEAPTPALIPLQPRRPVDP
ncbi:MAG: hypothetical protein M0Q42_04175 [Xanthomonadales bacterium]|nr:hypothetical protein [Xanthomonadales bacterium]